VLLENISLVNNIVQWSKDAPRPSLSNVLRFKVNEKKVTKCLPFSLPKRLFFLAHMFIQTGKSFLRRVIILKKTGEYTTIATCAQHVTFFKNYIIISFLVCPIFFSNKNCLSLRSQFMCPQWESASRVILKSPSFMKTSVNYVCLSKWSIIFFFFPENHQHLFFFFFFWRLRIHINILWNYPFFCFLHYYCEPEREFVWSYEGQSGPKYWGVYYEDAKGNYQSPINLQTAGVTIL